MDNYNLERYIKAQMIYYQIALKEVKLGLKKGHWMWYVFPQIIGLGKSVMSINYAIQSKEEAVAYLNNELLRKNLLEISTVLYDHKESNIVQIFGELDSTKLKSCMTLFAYISNQDSIFHKILDKYFDNQKDFMTIKILEKTARSF